MVKLVVLGAAGKVGAACVEAGLAAGHEVTAFVRSKEKLEQALPPGSLQRIHVVIGDASLPEDVCRALSGQQAAIQTAGYIGNTPQEVAAFGKLFATVADAAKKAHAAGTGPRRVWFLGGAGELEWPGRPGHLLIDVKGVPQRYRQHVLNFQHLQQECSSLDWSIACPGVLTHAPALSDVSRVNVTTEVLPVDVPSWSRSLPNWALTLPLAFIAKQLNGTTYQDVAAVMVANLEEGGPLSNKRVGFGGLEKPTPYCSPDLGRPLHIRIQLDQQLIWKRLQDLQHGSPVVGGGPTVGRRHRRPCS